MDRVYKSTVDYCLSLEFSHIILEHSFVQNTNKVYFAYPLLFEKLFTQVEFTSLFIEKLSIAGFLLYRSVIIQDRIRDNDEIEKVNTFGRELLIDVSEYCKTEAISVLKQIFKPESLFWQFFEEVRTDFLTEKEIENQVGQANSIYGKLFKFEELSYIKSIFGRLAVDALFVKALETTIEIEDTINLYEQHQIGIKQYKVLAFALQVVDDIEDISIDLECRQINIAIELCKKDGEDLSVEEVKRRFYFNKIAIGLLSLTLHRIDSVLKQPYNKNTTLSNLLYQVATMLYRKRHIIESYIQTEIYASTLIGNIYERNVADTVSFYINSIDGKVTNTSILRGVKQVIANATTHFKEAYHLMYLPENHGFGEGGVYIGNLFQLSTLLVFFQSLEIYIGVNFYHITQPICKYVLSKRQDNYHGTWCYLNDFKYLAPDIDDMSQIIRGLGRDLAIKYCLQALNVTAERIIQSGAPVSTWIPAIRPTPESKHQDYLNRTMWKDTIDIDVIANLLLLFDSICYTIGSNFEKASEILLNYILTQYNDAGEKLLLPRWYYSALYPIYLLSKLNYVSLPSYFVSKIVDLITRRQNSDGGWGNEYSLYRSDPLNTSLAVTSLQNLSRKAELNGIELSIAQGIDYIQQTQDSDGLWEKVDFIKPRFEEPYSSRLITSIFCLEALMNNERESV